jgi:stress-induced morphogen
MDQLVKERIEAAMTPTHLEVNVLDAASGKFGVVVVSNVFDGKALLARHRAVNELFKEELQSGTIHALTIVAKTPVEFTK